jgi:hypothetical protein
MLFGLDVVLIVSVLFYSGGLLALGAVVAPLVFRSGISGAADLMTSIFTRFDKVAIALVLVALATEAVSVVVRGGPMTRLRVARGALVVLFSLGVAVQSGVLSPTIARLHAEGVQRYVGPRGMEFDRIHNWSSRVGKLTVSLAIAAVVAVLLERRTAVSPARDRSVDAANRSQ